MQELGFQFWAFFRWRKLIQNEDLRNFMGLALIVFDYGAGNWQNNLCSFFRFGLFGDGFGAFVFRSVKMYDVCLRDVLEEYNGPQVLTQDLKKAWHELGGEQQTQTVCAARQVNLLVYFFVFANYPGPPLDSVFLGECDQVNIVNKSIRSRGCCLFLDNTLYYKDKSIGKDRGKHLVGTDFRIHLYYVVVVAMLRSRSIGLIQGSGRWTGNYGMSCGYHASDECLNKSGSVVRQKTKSKQVFGIAYSFLMMSSSIIEKGPFTPSAAVTGKTCYGVARDVVVASEDVLTVHVMRFVDTLKWPSVHTNYGAVNLHQPERIHCLQRLAVQSTNEDSAYVVSIPHVTFSNLTQFKVLVLQVKLKDRQQVTVLLRRAVKERRHEFSSPRTIGQVIVVLLLSGLLWWQYDISHLQDQTRQYAKSSSVHLAWWFAQGGSHNEIRKARF
ncbi:ABC transporter G family member 9 [Artemisia annua]|uniref:ABC transporter G family member 9 n=1 Tax=Artemisia annua TaxID=35608 RepID=A0A2U1QCV2_ARTAN|nr:ABC transporter G family member 9 [Artemisia annua]